MRKLAFGLGTCLGVWTTVAPLSATILIQSIVSSAPSPQPVGTSVTWTVAATDTTSSPLLFQFNVAYGNEAFSLARDFNLGTQTGSIWKSRPFVWNSIAGDGNFRIQVVVKDSFGTSSQTATFQLTSRVINGHAGVTATSNPLVALFSAPSCPAGSSMRVTFQHASIGNTTNWKPCAAPASMNFYVAGMTPNTVYSMNYQVLTSGKVINGPTPLSFTTGSVSASLNIPQFNVLIPPGSGADTTDYVILHDFLSPAPFPVATNVQGQILWYYKGSTESVISFITRPLNGGTFLTFQDGPAWNAAAQFQQLLSLVDLAGNTIAQTNTGVVQQQALALGAANFGPCNVAKIMVGTACLTGFYHDAILLPNGNIATIVILEKIFPPGTQGDASGLPVDILGNGILVLNRNLQVVWYWDSFQHAGGTPELDINRPAVLGETCSSSADPNCPHMLLLHPGVTAPVSYDWLKCNSLFFSPSQGNFLLSVEHQDWIIKIDYRNGSGTGKILWRMGRLGDFTFNNVNNDPWPWFSHQHDVGYANNGAGPLTLLDNGTTRVSPLPLGLGSGDSRGMALSVNETSMTVSPVLVVDLGVFGPEVGSAQMLPNRNYHFQAQTAVEQDLEIAPTPGTTGGTTDYLMATPGTSYRSWRMSSLYNAPAWP